MTDEIPVDLVGNFVEPVCCWCKAPLVIEDRKAWCSGSKKCRKKQRSCAVVVERDGVEEILFLPSPRQTDVMMATEPNVFIWGNRGGGKSVAIRWMCHALATAVPGFKYAILRTSFPELMKNHLIFLEDEMNRLGGEKAGFNYHKTDHVCYYPNGSIGFYAQCANDADVKKILGAEVALVVFDEAPTFQWEHMRLIAASIRVPVGSGLIPMTRYLGNPIGESIDHLWSYFIDKDVSPKDDPEYRLEDWRAIEIRIEDNPHLDAKKYWKQMSGLAPHYLKAWREGIRIEENSLFEFYPKLNGAPYHVIHEVPLLSDGNPLFSVDDDGTWHFPDWVQIYRAYDHGFWPDPSVCLWFAVFGRRILCFKEMTRYRTLITDFMDEVVEESQGMRVVTTYCDPSLNVEDGKDINTPLQKAENHGVPMDPSVNNREYIPDAIHSLLNEQISPTTPRMQIMAPGSYRGCGCPDLIKSLPKMKFDEKNPARMADSKWDHWPIAVGYYGMSNIPETSPKKSRMPRRWQLPLRARGSSAARVLALRMERAQHERHEE